MLHVPHSYRLDPMHAAMTAEFSEAHAYASLAELAAGMDTPPLVAQPLGGGIALRGNGDRSTTLFDRAIGLGLREPITLRTMAALAQYFAHGTTPWGLELAPPALTPEVLRLLKEARLRRGLPTAMIAMDCRRVVGERPRWNVRQVGAEWAAAVADLVARAFNVSEPVAAILGRAAACPRFVQWLAFEDEQPVAACLTHVHGDTAWFGWSATAPTHRRRGLQGALLWHCVRDAAERGCRWITAETATGSATLPDASYRNMLRFGFVELYRRFGYLHVPRTTGIRAKT